MRVNGADALHYTSLAVIALAAANVAANRLFIPLKFCQSAR